MDFESLRREYGGQELTRDDLSDNPFDQFEAWFQNVLDAGVELPDAMSLATCTETGDPTVRQVVLRGFNRDGFRFFTNLKSLKARQLKEHPEASLVFYWKPFHRQVRIKGTVTQISRKEVEEYFATRPRRSQLAAHVSDQTDVVEGRDRLEKEFEKYQSRFEGKDVPCPESWGGFRLKPDRFFFWQGRKGRLHDRFRYQREGESWVLERIAP